MTEDHHPRNAPRQMSTQAFLALGSMQIVYVKPVVSDGDEAYAIHGADGTQLAVVADRDLAFVTARQNDLDPVSVH